MTADHKPWAVLCLVANSGQVLPKNTRYFWTSWGAKRYARRIGDGLFYRLKVVRNSTSAALHVAPGTYAVKHLGEWHIAVGDGDAYRVISDWQSGDRWAPEWLDRVVDLNDLVNAHAHTAQDPEVSESAREGK